MAMDHHLIEDCKKGKRRAQGRLYKKYSGVMLGVCLRYSKDLPEAEDILQEGFIKVFSNIHQLKEYGALEAWIRRIMVNTAISHLNKKRLHFDAIDDSVSYEQEAQDEGYLPVEPATLMKMIQELPAGYRTVLNLYVFEDFTHKQIAEILGITESTSKTQLFKARNLLRKQLENKNRTTQNIVRHETGV